ncbi:ricin B lectin domain-containing protein, partial [Gymnopilus junonius]
GCISSDVFSIVNLCPHTITLYINGESHGPLSTFTAINATFNNTWSGMIYTDANGGRGNGNSTMRAGFYGSVRASYYYIVKDADMNTGLSIIPQLSAGFCGIDICDSTYCPWVYDSLPASFSEPGPLPPSTPLFSCPSVDVGYTVTFCPEKTFPPSNGTVNIHPNGETKKCLDVQGAVYATALLYKCTYDCNDTSAQRWTLSSGGGMTSVVLAGTDFCLDAGSNPSSGTRMKIWQCFNSLPAQSWEVTSAHQLKLSGTNQCLDLRNSLLQNENEIQTGACGTTNPNQIWTTTDI